MITDFGSPGRICVQEDLVLSNSVQKMITWWYGYCDSNKGECDLNQSKDDSFVKRVAKNNNWNNGDHHKIHEISLINFFCFRYNSSLTNSTQFGNDSNYSKFNGENIATNCSRVTVLALDSLTRNTLATTLSWKFFSSNHQAHRNAKACKLCQASRKLPVLNKVRMPTQFKPIGRHSWTILCFPFSKKNSRSR